MPKILTDLSTRDEVANTARARNFYAKEFHAGLIDGGSMKIVTALRMLDDRDFEITYAVGGQTAHETIQVPRENVAQYHIAEPKDLEKAHYSKCKNSGCGKWMTPTADTCSCGRAKIEKVAVKA